ncbi:M20/M25/M40 family metallo-hydrolase [Cesiribacter sp. SM1]|uniref:M20/M25/M40 family metallo-hydrolase n=1 Tax=Cesiribacter sp. SM1 TaxID=2861196 RepID=UPI001CD6AE2E
MLLIATALTPGTTLAQTEEEQFIRQVYDTALVHGKSYELLRQLTKNVGHRLSGSAGAQKAVDWGQQVMQELRFDTVWLQEVTVPHWERGKAEKVTLLGSGKDKSLKLQALALGSSAGTGPKGVTAPVVMVNNFDELEQLGRQGVEGKIVFYNFPMNPSLIKTGQAYGEASPYRTHGPSIAAKLGAVGALVRSLTTALDHVPHTGTTIFEAGVKPIPALAISTLDAEMLSKKLKSGKTQNVYIETHSRTLPDARSYNVIGEIRGSEQADKIITIGGHLDSWDVGEGAHDDGTGVVQSIEALRILKALGYQPRHTIRAVLFMNEENGLRGGRKYAEEAARKGEKHIAAMESDNGGFTPIGFTVDATQEAVAAIEALAPLFKKYQVNEFGAGGSGADISPLKPQGTILIGYRPDTQRYFDIHHTAEDTFEKVNKRELELGAAAMTSLLYLLDKNLE